MKKTKQSSFIEWNYNILVSSIKKINLNIILIVILDILFYFLSGYLVILWLRRIQLKMSAFNLPTDIAALGYEKAQEIAGEARAFLFLLILSIILVALAIIFLASILKGIIWAKTTNTKITLRLISKFLRLNLIWICFWFVMIILISLFIQPALAPKFMIMTIILALYFTNTLYAIFMKEQKLKVIFRAIKLNITKLHLFLLPHIIIWLLFYIIIILSNLFKYSYSTTVIHTSRFYVPSFVLVLVIITYASFVRHYVSTLVLEIEKPKPL